MKSLLFLNFRLLFPIGLLFISNSGFTQGHSSAVSGQSKSKLKEGIYKIYYDSTLNTLDAKDSLKASYYRVINYRKGKIDGAVTDYYGSGVPMMIGYYTDDDAVKGSENGKFIYYYENGNIFQTCSYVNGVLEGIYIEYYPSGLKKASVSYSKGVRFGCVYAWDESGKLVQKGFIENDSSYSRSECDTVEIDQNPANSAQNNTSIESNQSAGEEENFIDHFNKEFSGGNYETHDKVVYYKSRDLRLVSASVVDELGRKIEVTSIRPGQHLFLHITLSGLTKKNETYRFIMAQNQVDSYGNNYGNSGDGYSDSNSDYVDLQLGGGIQSLPAGVSSKDIYFSFRIKDKNSRGIIHGYFKFTVVL